LFAKDANVSTAGYSQGISNLSKTYLFKNKIKKNDHWKVSSYHRFMFFDGFTCHL